MAQPFNTIITGNSHLDRIQQNIANALNAPNNPETITVNTNPFTVSTTTNFLFIPTTSLPNGANTAIALPDAVANPGFSFKFKKTDTSSNNITFSSTFKNKQGVTQTVEGASSYSTNASMASGTIISDGNNYSVTS